MVRPIEDQVAELYARAVALEARFAAAEEVLTQRMASVVGRADDFEAAAERLLRALREGRIDGGGDLVQSVTTLLGVDPRGFREDILWLRQQNRRARR